MRVGLYNPFLSARSAGLGGGDKYLMAILEEATRLPAAEVVLWSPERPGAAELDLLGVDLDPGAFDWRAAASEQVVTEASRDLDLLVVTTCNIPPRSHAGRSVAVVQFPFAPRDRLPARIRARLLAPLGLARGPDRLASYDLYVCYSRFARDWTRRRLGVEATVIAPPVAPAASPPPPKRDLILAVGRFFPGFHNKKHDVLIEAFAALRERLGPEADWELGLVGSAGTDRAALGYLERLRAAAAGLPVRFEVNATPARLAKLYGEAALFWHATGYGEDPERHPERLEHFGMTTVEAMAHEAVPLVYPAGGQAEIVADGGNGVHWRSPPELVERSLELIADPGRRERLAEHGREEAARYAPERFREAVRDRVLAGAGLP